MLQQHPVLCYLLASVLLYWVMLIFASGMHTKLWTWTGWLLAVGNRDKMPEKSLVMARADRAAKNMAENLIIFSAVALTAAVTGTNGKQVLLGAQIFFFARLIYLPLYLAGVSWVRTITWAVGLVGVALIAAAIFQIRIIA